MSDGAIPQARPVEGRALPTRARGARPTFFEDGATDAVISMVTALAAEVWALRERIDSLEAVLEARACIDEGEVESYRPDPEHSSSRAEEAAAFTGRVFRVFEEMREEIVAGDDQSQYLALVERALGEV